MLVWTGEHRITPWATICRLRLNLRALRSFGTPQGSVEQVPIFFSELEPDG